MASMEKDFFWGCELSKDKKEYSWDSEDEEISKADIEQKLVVSQACLGPKAKANEKNLVQVTTTDSSDSSVTFTILSLTSGKTDQCRLSLAFPSSATFNLIEGSGPVHLTGTVYQELYLLDDEEESDEDEDELVKSEDKVGGKKRPLASETPKGPPKKLARVEVDKEGSEEDDDDDDDEGESTEESTKMEVDTKQKQNKTEQTPKTSKKKQEGKDVKVKKKDTEEDSEEDEESEDESDEDDDEEEESDEDESEEDESDEDDDEEEDESDEDEITTSLTAKKQEAKGAKKKPITNGVVKQDKKNKQEKSKTPAQQPSTPKTGANKDEVKKSGSKTPQPLDMDKMKERLLKTPNLPKKVDKFKNYMKNSYKVTDDAELTKIWEWVKANK